MAAAPVPYFPDPPKRPRPKAKAKRRKPRAKKVCQSATPPEASAPPPVVGTLVPQAHGGALRVGNPGNKGRSLDAQRERFRQLLADPDAEEMLAKILRGEAFEFKGALVLVDPDTYLRAHAYCMERGYGKAAPETELQADPGKPRQLVVRMIHELKAG